MNQNNLNWRESHLNQRIPGAIHLDLNEICDHESKYPFMLPNEV